MLSVAAALSCRRGEDEGEPAEVVWESLAVLLHRPLEGGAVLEGVRLGLGAACLPLPRNLRLALYEEDWGKRQEPGQEMVVQDWRDKRSRVVGYVTSQEAQCPLLVLWREEWGRQDQLLVQLLSLLHREERDLQLLYWLQPILALLHTETQLCAEKCRGGHSEQCVLKLARRIQCQVSACRLEDQELHELVDQVFLELGERDRELLDHLEQVCGSEERMRLGQVRAGLLALGARGEELEEELTKEGGWLEGELLREACAGGGRLFIRIWLSEVNIGINIRSSLVPFRGEFRQN